MKKRSMTEEEGQDLNSLLKEMIGENADNFREKLEENILDMNNKVFPEIKGLYESRFKEASSEEEKNNLGLFLDSMNIIEGMPQKKLLNLVCVGISMLGLKEIQTTKKMIGRRMEDLLEIFTQTFLQLTGKLDITVEEIRNSKESKEE